MINIAMKHTIFIEYEEVGQNSVIIMQITDRVSYSLQNAVRYF